MTTSFLYSSNCLTVYDWIFVLLILKKKRIFYIETQQNTKNEKKIIKNKRN